MPMVLVLLGIVVGTASSGCVPALYHEKWKTMPSDLRWLYFITQMGTLAAGIVFGIAAARAPMPS